MNTDVRLSDDDAPKYKVGDVVTLVDTYRTTGTIDEVFKDGLYEFHIVANDGTGMYAVPHTKIEASDDQAPEIVHSLTPISDDEVIVNWVEMVAERDARIAELENAITNALSNIRVGWIKTAISLLEDFVTPE